LDFEQPNQPLFEMKFQQLHPEVREINQFLDQVLESMDTEESTQNV